MSVTRAEVVDSIAMSNGKFFSIQFVKRSTGEVRQMLARTGVKKFLTGGGLKFDPVVHKLITVWDVQKEAYRSIPIEGITHFKVEGEWEDVIDESQKPKTTNAA